MDNPHHPATVLSTIRQAAGFQASQGVLPPPANNTLDAIGTLQTLIKTTQDDAVIHWRSKAISNEEEKKKVEVEKEAVMIELTRARGGEREMERTKASLKKQLEALDSENVTQKTTIDSYEGKLAVLRKENKALAAELDKLNEYLVEGETKFNQLEQINYLFSSDLKAQKQIQSKLLSDYEQVSKENKVLIGQLDSGSRHVEKIAQENAELRVQAERSLADNKSLKNMIEQGELLLQQNAVQKRDVEQNWEEAMNAMHDRDAVLEKLQNRATGLTTKLHSTEAELQRTRQDLEKKETECINQAKKQETLDSQTAALRSQIAGLLQLRKNADATLNVETIARRAAEEELEKTKSHAERQTDLVQKRDAVIAELKNQNAALKERMNSERNKDSIQELIAKERESLEGEASDTVNKIQKQAFISDTVLRNDIANKSIEIIKLKDQLDGLIRTNDVLEGKFRSSQATSEKLQEEVRHLAFSLAHRERDMNLLLAKTSEIKPEDQLAPLQNSIKSMQKDLEIQKLENLRLQEMWLRNQKEVTTKTKLFDELKKENEDMRTRINITDTVKQKLLQTTEELQKDSVESNVEYSKLYAEIGVLKPLVRELQSKNADLEFELASALLTQDEARLAEEVETNTLKYQVRLIDKQKSDASAEVYELTKKITHLERKVTVSKEMFDKVKQERSDLQRANFELNVRYTALHTKFTFMQQQFKDLTESTGRAMQIQSERERKPKSAEEYEIIDLPALQMRVTTLTHEKVHLQKELELARSRVTLLGKQLALAESSLQANNEQSSNLTFSSTSMAAEQERLRARLSRAEGIAASLEAQFKAALPNAKIDYTISEDASIMLMNFISSELPAIAAAEKRYTTSTTTSQKSLSNPYAKSKQSLSKSSIIAKRKTSLTVE